MRRSLSLVALAALFALSLAAQAQQRLRVAAAADLQPVLPSILAEFTSQTGIHATASYKSSAVLSTEILNGAPFDLFMAADLSFPQRVVAAGLAEESAPVPYARGTLVLWTHKDSPIHNLSIDSLRDPALRSLSIANPRHAPYGHAAVETLRSLHLYDALRSKLVVAENIAQAAQYAESGNAQMGFISLTSALTPHMRATGHYVIVPRGDYSPLIQGAVIIKRSKNPGAAQRFLTFLRSPAIEQQLAAKGLAPAR